jgi:serine/threonine-protein kinase ULK/ATG1
MEKKA